MSAVPASMGLGPSSARAAIVRVEGKHTMRALLLVLRSDPGVCSTGSSTL